LLKLRIIFSMRHEHADPARLFDWLRAHRRGLRHGQDDNRFDEIPSSHDNPPRKSLRTFQH